MSKQETHKAKAEQTSQINLADLPVADEQADRATGGTGATNNQGRLIVGVDNARLEIR
jgi:hypothetical protein